MLRRMIIDSNPRRSGMEERRLRKASARPDPRAIFTDHHDLESHANAQAVADTSEGRHRDRPAGGTSHAHRRQRHAVPNSNRRPITIRSRVSKKIKARLIAINSADDQVNPPELGILEREIKRVKHGRYVLIPISDETRRARDALGGEVVEAVRGGVAGELTAPDDRSLRSRLSRATGQKVTPISEPATEEAIDALGRKL